MNVIIEQKRIIAIERCTENEDTSFNEWIIQRKGVNYDKDTYTYLVSVISNRFRKERA